MSDEEPIASRLRLVAVSARPAPATTPSPVAAVHSPAATVFNRQELKQILNLYGRKVAAGEWRDYAIDFNREKAVFSIFRRASECPLYTIEKVPALARKQGAYSVVTATGMILKRGPELARVLEVLDKRVKLMSH